ncbi:MAG TPA: VOC family protein [Chryseosolibacter sp.]
MKSKSLPVICILLTAGLLPFSAKSQVTRPFAPGDVFLPDLASIVANDINKVSRWYADNLGFKLFKQMSLPQHDSLRIDFLEKGMFKLEIVGKKKAADRRPLTSFENPSITGYNKISFRVVNINVLAEKLKASRVTFRTPVFHDDVFRLTSFIVEDPEGNLVQFVEYDR